MRKPYPARAKRRKPDLRPDQHPADPVVVRLFNDVQLAA